jgi:competence protein ComEA
MKFQDFFYFSRGERRALVLLAILVCAAWIMLFIKDENRPADALAANQTPPSISYAKPGYGKNSQYQSGKTNKTTAKRSDYSARFRSRFFATPSAEKKDVPRSEKFPAGTVVELNSADTTVLKKVPGIGSSFAKRIVRYREMLGGFYCVDQLAEVYGMDEERFAAIVPWFKVDASAITKQKVNGFSWNPFPKHPYLSYPQKKILIKMVEQKGRLKGWEEIELLEEFTPQDRERLEPYLSFE